MKHPYASQVCFLLLAPALFAGQPLLHRQQVRLMANGLAKHAKTAAVVQNPTYDYRTIEFPLALLTIAADVNDRGMVAGQYGEIVDGQFLTRSFTLDKGTYRSIIYPGAELTLVSSLTNNNLVLGNWGTSTVQHAGTYDLRTGVFTQLPDISGKLLNFGYRMNEKGVAIGAACDGDLSSPVGPTDCIGWRRENEIYTFFTVPGTAAGGIGTIPNSINDSGLEVGFWDTATKPFDAHAYARDKHGFAQINPFGLENSVAYDVNAHGQILMLAPLDPNAYWRPLLWERGQAVALPLYPNFVDSHTLYTGINNRGDLSGFWYDDNFFPSSFVAVRK